VDEKVVLRRRAVKGKNCLRETLLTHDRCHSNFRKNTCHTMRLNICRARVIGLHTESAGQCTHKTKDGNLAGGREASSSSSNAGLRDAQILDVERLRACCVTSCKAATGLPFLDGVLSCESTTKILSWGVGLPKETRVRHATGTIICGVEV